MKALSADSILARLLGKLTAAVFRHPRWFIYPQVALFAGVRALHRRLPESGHEPGQPGRPQPEVSPELSPAAKGVSPAGQRPGGGGGKRQPGEKPAVCRTPRHEDGAGNQPVPRRLLPARSGDDGDQGAVLRAGRGPGRHSNNAARRLSRSSASSRRPQTSSRFSSKSTRPSAPRPARRTPRPNRWSRRCRC